MGWTFSTTTQTKAALIRHRIGPQTSNGRLWTVIAHRVTKEHLWKVIEITNPGLPPIRYIGLDLLMKGPNGYGYKDLDESAGPYAYDCPLSFLAMAPEQHKTWRAKVREHHAFRRAQFDLIARTLIGSTIRLRHAAIPEFTLTSKTPLLGHYHGTLFRGTLDMVDPGLPEPGTHESDQQETEQQATDNRPSVRIADRHCDTGQILSNDAQASLFEQLSA